MAVSSYRAQAILDKNDFARLQAIAERQGRTISETIREAVRRYLEEQEQQEAQQFLASLTELRQIRERAAAQYGVYEGNLVNEAREERERERAEIWKPSL